jgi:hypothetical protein
MKRVENYRGYVIDTDNMGRQYIYFKNSPFSEDCDHTIIGTGLKLKEIKRKIDERIE